MYIIQILNLIACLIYAELTVFVLCGKKRKDEVNRSLGLFLGCFVLWSFCLSVVQSPFVSEPQAFFWLNIYTIAWTSFSSIFLYFVLVFTSHKRALHNTWITAVLIVPPVLFTFTQYTSGIVTLYPEKQSYGFTYQWQGSLAMYLYYTYMSFSSIYALFLLNRFRKSTTDAEKKKQASIIIHVTTVALIAGILADVLLPELRIYRIPRLAPLTTLIWALGLVYAIARHQFLAVTTSVVAEQIIDTLNECLIFADGSGKIVRVNKAALDLLGWTKDELIGQDMQKIFPQEYFTIIISQRLKDQQELRNQDALFYTKDKTLIDVILTLSFIKDDHYKTLGVIFIARDISERKKTESQLRKLAAVVEHNLELVSLATVDGGIFFLNEAGRKMLGIEQDHISEHHMMEFIPEHYKDLVYKEVLPLVLKGNTWEGDLQYRHLKTGALIDVHSIVFGIKEASSPVISFLAYVSLDITASKRMQDKLKDEKEFTDAIMQSMPGVFYLFDQEGHFLRWNPELEKITGYSAEEIARMSPLDLFKGDDKERIQKAIHDVFEKGMSSIEGDFITKAGERIPYLFHGYRIIYAGKTLLIGVGIDISSQRLIAKDLMEKQARLNGILKASPIGIGVVVNRVVTQVNERLCAMVGYTGEELIGQSARMLYVTEEDFEFVGREKYRQIAEKGVGTVETVWRKKDGSLINVWLSSAVIDRGNPHSGVVFTAQDITASKCTERLLMEAANEWRDTFDAMADGVSIHSAEHDILNSNESLSKIIGKTKDELVGKKCYEIFHGMNHPVSGCPLESCKASGHKEYREFFEPFLKKWLAVSVAPVLDHEGKTTKIVHSIRDISASKEAEQLLKRSEELLQETQSISKSGGWEFDVEKGRITWTDQVYQIYGVSKDFDPSNIPQDMSFYAQETLPVLQEAFRRALEKAEPYDLKLAFKNAQGKQLWVRTIGNPVVIDGKVARISGNIVDITEQKVIEQTLQQRCAIEAAIAEISTRFLNASAVTLDQEIQGALRKMIEQLPADRAYVFLFYDHLTKMNNTHEWCREGVAPQQHNLQGIDIAAELPWFLEKIKSLQHSYLFLVDELPPEAWKEKEHFKKQQIQSLVVVPLIHDSNLIGFVGLDMVSCKKTWDSGTVNVLTILGQAIANAIMRTRTEEALRQALSQIK